MQALYLPFNSFDLVNQRLGSSYLRIWDWPHFLEQLQYVIKPGGIVRLTEVDIMKSTSPALNRTTDLLQQALYQAGHLPSQANRELGNELEQFLQRLDFQDVQTQTVTIEYRANTPEWENFYNYIKLSSQALQPFLFKWLRISDYEKLRQQMIDEMEQADFVGTWKLVTTWGHKRRTGQKK